MKTFTTSILSVTFVIGILYLFANALQKTDKNTCESYVQQATNIQGWYITQPDYKMCLYYGLDFSDYLIKIIK